MDTHRGSSAQSMLLSTNGWQSWQAISTDFLDATGQLASTTSGLAVSKSSGLLERFDRGRRMHSDERCRKAVCRRTARTVWSGAAGESDVHIGDRKKSQSDDPLRGHRQSPMRLLTQPAAYLTRVRLIRFLVHATQYARRLL